MQFSGVNAVALRLTGMTKHLLRKSAWMATLAWEELLPEILLNSGGKRSSLLLASYTVAPRRVSKSYYRSHRPLLPTPERFQMPYGVLSSHERVRR